MTAQLSAVLRDQLLAELASLAEADAATAWAHKRLAAKNTLADRDALQVEEAFALRLESLTGTAEPVSPPPGSPAARASFTRVEQTARGDQTLPAGQGPLGEKAPPDGNAASEQDPAPDWLGPADPEPFTIPAGVDKSALAIAAPRRFRDKAHLALVATQPCLVCGKRPVDPHHVRFAQGRALGRKVSDEFTVPLCRSHHRELHRSGDEYVWWENRSIDPLKIARKLWKKTRLKSAPGASRARRGAAVPEAGGATGETVGRAEAPAGASVSPSASDVAAAVRNAGTDRR